MVEAKWHSQRMEGKGEEGEVMVPWLKRGDKVMPMMLMATT